MKIIDSNEKVTGAPTPPPPPKPAYAQVKKNLIICNVSDATGCGHIRCILPFNYINSVFGKDMTLAPFITPIFIKQPDILLRSRSILFQRQMSPEHINTLRQYKELQKQFKFKLVYDFDDLLWGKNEFQGGDKFHGIPSYNFASDRVSPEMKEASLEIMKMCDVITTSTHYLKDYVTPLVDGTPVEYLQNTVPVYLWGRKERPPETEDIKKPVVVFNESPTHYSNEKKMYGDLDNAWRDWFIKAVLKDEIELHVMGGLPFFFEEIRSKVKIYEWLSAYQYPYVMKMINPHFVISPLVPNEFNSSKSDIKKIEAQANGSVPIGTVFGDRPSPYDNNIVKAPVDIDVQGIDELIKKYTERDLFNSIVMRGYRELEQQDRYTESSGFINKINSIF